MQAVAMDHRCGHRRTASQTVLLRRNGWAGYLVGELRDVSISGARVAVPARAFPLRTLVRLEVTVTTEVAAATEPRPPTGIEELPPVEGPANSLRERIAVLATLGVAVACAGSRPCGSSADGVANLRLHLRN